jgi:hypothetical protein
MEAVATGTDTGEEAECSHIGSVEPDQSMMCILAAAGAAGEGEAS